MHEEDKVTYFAETDARNKRIRFGIKNKDRTRHIYAIGKTGMGKSTLLENLAIQDIQNGEGFAFIDPHGKTADLLLEYIPEHRKKDVIYFAPFDLDYPIAFNVLEDVGPEKRHLVANGLMSAFKKIWVDAWSARMEYILSNIMLALLEYPGSSLLGVNRMLADKDFRNAVVENITDPSVKSFWVDEYAKYTEKFAADAAPAIQNKVGQFVANPLVRNIIGQAKSSFDIREVMDNKKILIINLSKGRVGEANANLLGSMLITKIYLAAMSRADLREDELKKVPQFYLYVDEFQSFANESFADILSEARKYKLNLTIAHQYIEQMTDEVRAAVFGNVGTMITFRVGAHDGSVFEKEYAPEFTAEDLVNLQQYQMYLKLMIDGVTSRPFSAIGMAPIPKPEISYYEDILKLSRDQFAAPREKIESEIREWHEKKIKPASSSSSSAGSSSGGSSSSAERPKRDGGDRGSRSSGKSSERSSERSGDSRSGDRSNSVRGDRSGDRPRSADGDRSGNGRGDRPSNTSHEKPNIVDPILSSALNSNSITSSNPNPIPNPNPAQDPNPLPNNSHTTSVNKTISLTNLNSDSTENKSKNNQKIAKPENVNALRNALLSIVGEDAINKKEEKTNVDSSAGVNSNAVVNEKPSNPVHDKNTQDEVKSNTDSISASDLKKILEID